MATLERGDVLTSSEITIDTLGLSLREFSSICAGAQVNLAGEVWDLIHRKEKALESLLEGGTTIYGVTTSVGAANDQRIDPSLRSDFQLSTLLSHACGTGVPLDRSQARGVWLAKLASIATGYSGASTEVVKMLLALLNAGLAPLVPRVGSLGASGDLIPSAHAALPLIGEDRVTTSDGRTVDASYALSELDLAPISLGPRDGLSLVNGTATTLSIACHQVNAITRFVDLADLVATASLEAHGGHPDAFSKEVGDARPILGMKETMQRIREALDGVDSNLLSKRGVHDPYSWRCLPQVHGSLRSALSWVTSICDVELGSCSDNPIITSDELVISGGNFHGAPLGLGMDTLSLAIGEVAALSRQRISHLTDSLPENEPIPKVAMTMLLTSVTASLLEISTTGVATGRWLPIDEIEDHVSNSTMAALHCESILHHGYTILAGEVLATGVMLRGMAAGPTSKAGKWLLAATDKADSNLLLGSPAAAMLGRVTSLLKDDPTLPTTLRVVSHES